jgi:pyruvate dehydrogenase E1 component alpha subunit
LVEIMNYRFAGHGAADNDQSLYRTEKELKDAMKRDPIANLEAYMLDHNVVTEKELEKTRLEIESEMEDVYDKASKSPKPDPEEVYTDVYSDMIPEKGH